MSKSYRKITGDDRFWIERGDDEYTSPLRFLIHADPEPVMSAVLSTYEIGQLATTLSLIYYRRTGKMPMFVQDDDDSMPVATFDEMPVSTLPEPPQERCAFCNGECTGDCI